MLSILFGILVTVLSTKTGREYIMTAYQKVTQKGLDILKYFEGFRSKPYYDEGGKLTVGYGHLIKSGETFNYITPEQGEQLLASDLSKAENIVRNFVTVPLTENQFDALVSFVFNVGGGAFQTSTLLRKLNSGDYSGAADELNRWIYITVNGEKQISNILVSRREHEKQIFLG